MPPCPRHATSAEPQAALRPAGPDDFHVLVSSDLSKVPHLEPEQTLALTSGRQVEAEFLDIDIQISDIQSSGSGERGEHEARPGPPRDGSHHATKTARGATRRSRVWF